jgi:hypothetical protein
MSERERFEEWATTKGYALAFGKLSERYNIVVSKPEEERYLSPDTRHAWEAWQARAALPKQQRKPAAQ